MALSLPRLIVAIQGAYIAGGALPGNPLLIAMSANLASAIMTEFQSATVTPLGDPPMLAPAGGGPVTGTGKIT